MCSAPNVYMFVYILIETDMVPLMLLRTKTSILLPFAVTLAKVHLTLQTLSEVKQHYCQAGVKLEK